MGIIRKVQVNKFSKGEFREATDLIIEESSLDMIINDVKISAKILAENIEYFVYGFLLTNFFIETLDDIQELKVKKNQVEVILKVKKKPTGKVNLVSSCFSSEEVFSELKGIKSNVLIDPESIMENTSKFLKQGKYFSETGGTHLAALFKKKDLVVCFEDIGRHNAIDKVVGYILKENLIPEEYVIYTTGRISSEIVKKVIRAQVPVLVSRSAVTCAAMNMSLVHNLKVIGFSRNQRFNIYS